MTLTPHEANVLRCLKQDHWIDDNLFRPIMPKLVEKGLAKRGTYDRSRFYPTEEGMSLDV